MLWVCGATKNMFVKNNYKKIVWFFLVALVCVPSTVFAASLSISPSAATYSVGERVTVRVNISGDRPLNAVSGAVTFPPQFFTIESISKTGSILNFWVTEPSFSKASGQVLFEGVALSGFAGGAGTVMTVTLRPVKEGSGQITFEAGQILANDGQGTNITSGLNPGAFTIVPAKPTPKPKVEPEPEEVVEPEPVKPATLITPTITTGKQDGLLAIIGSSQYSKADVLLTFVSSSGSKVFITGTTDHNGNFVLIVPQALKNGPYSVTAVVVLPDGTYSPQSNTLTIEVGGVFYGEITWQTVVYVCLALIVVLVLLLAYSARRRSRSKGGSSSAIKRETREAESILHRSFKVLRQNLDLHKKRDQAHGKDVKGDLADLAALKKDLSDAEDVIAREIDDINKQ